MDSTTDLENMTKHLIPDYNFDTFGTKFFKISKKNSEENARFDIKTNNYTFEEDSDNETKETTNDEQCQRFSLEITHETRNLLIRTKDQEENRRKLPIYLKETEIIDSINNNFITIICGETGSGFY